MAFNAYVTIWQQSNDAFRQQVLQTLISSSSIYVYCLHGFHTKIVNCSSFEKLERREFCLLRLATIKIRKAFEV